MPPKTRLRSSVASYDSPDPLALSENGLQRETSPAKFSPSKPTGGYTTPKRTRNSNAFLEESQVKSVSSHSVHQPGSGSPWKIRVTVEAEPEEDENQGSPLRNRNNLWTQNTVTTTVPLRDRDGGTPARRRGRPSKSTPGSGGGSKRKRPSTPGRRSSDINVEDDLPAVVQGDQHDPEDTPQGQASKRRRGRARKSEAHEMAISTLAGSENDTTMQASNGASNMTLTNDLNTAGQGASTEHIDHGKGTTTRNRQSKTLEERLLAEDDTTALDLSAFESEGFSMVSIESLRSEKEKAAREARVNEANERVAITSQASSQLAIKATGAHQNVISQSATNPPAAQHQASHTESESLGSQANQARPNSAQALRSSFGFGSGTYKQLRARYMMGELLSRGAAGGEITAIEEEPGSNHENGQAPLTPKPSPPYPRLPTPADSVEGDVFNHDKSMQSARQKPTEAIESTPAKDYDEMSWVPTGRPKMAIESNPQTQDHANRRTSLPVETELSQSSMNKRKRNANGSFSNGIPAAATPQVAKLSQTVGVDSPRDVTMADDGDLWQAEADRSFEESNEGRRRPIPKLPTKTPDWNDLLGEDTRPLRSKIPRTWRRVSGDYFKYSDEVDGDQTPVATTPHDSAHEPHSLDKYYSSEESSIEQQREREFPSSSFIDRAAAVINAGAHLAEESSIISQGQASISGLEEEESSTSEAIPRQQQSLFNPSKMYGRLFGTPKTPVSTATNEFETPLSSVIEESDTEDEYDEEESTVNGEVDTRSEAQNQSVASRPGIFTRLSSWLFAPKIPLGTVWDRNHYVLLDDIYRKDHAASMLPPLPKDVAAYIGTSRHHDMHNNVLTYSEHDMRTVYLFIQEAKENGIPQVCDGQFMRPSMAPKTDKHGNPYPLLDEEGNVIRVKEVWDVEEVSERVFTIWLGDIIRARREEGGDPHTP